MPGSVYPWAVWLPHLGQGIVISYVNNYNRLHCSSLLPPRGNRGHRRVWIEPCHSCAENLLLSLEENLDWAARPMVSHHTCSMSFSPCSLFFSHTQFSASWCPNLFCFRACAHVILSVWNSHPISVLVAFLLLYIPAWKFCVIWEAFPSYSAGWGESRLTAVSPGYCLLLIAFFSMWKTVNLLLPTLYNVCSPVLFFLSVLFP